MNELYKKNEITIFCKLGVKSFTGISFNKNKNLSDKYNIIVQFNRNKELEIKKKELLISVQNYCN